MKRLKLEKPVSGGILLSYKCNSECKHCMYASSPKWKADWINESDLRKILDQLSEKIEPSPFGPHRTGINYGLHLTGGEPFLNFSLLLKATEILRDLKIPSTFVETNCFWCIDEEETEDKLMKLRETGLNGILISVNPFVLEYVPFERTEKVITVSREIFGDNLMIYQEYFYYQFKALKIRGVLSFNDYLRKTSFRSLYHAELLPMGRAVYKLDELFRKYPAKRFFELSCKEELTRGWHFHVDNYCNYMTGYCGGISLGDARNLNSLIEDGVDLDDRPIIKALVEDLEKLYEMAVKNFEYKELKGGYISKCHLCLDIRKHIVQITDEFRELKPAEFYRHL